MVSVTSKVNYSILRAILGRKEPFTQYEIARTAGASPAQTSRVVQWLMRTSGIERRSDGRYRVVGPATIVTSVFPYQRSMSATHAATIRVRGSRKHVTEVLISAGGILCLESALEEYSSYFRPSRVCAYHLFPDRVVNSMLSHEGGVIPIELYVPDIPLEGDVEEGRRTSRFRTLIDLVCDSKTYVAKDLFEDLWGVMLE